MNAKLIYTLFMKSECLSAAGPGGWAGALAENPTCSPVLNDVSLSTVGWHWPLSRFGGAPQRHPDVVAPHHCQALPHTAV